MVDGTDAAEFLRPGGCRFALVEARHERAFLRRADAIGLRYAPPQRFEGYNYSIGRAVSIAVYRSEARRERRRTAWRADAARAASGCARSTRLRRATIATLVRPPRRPGRLAGSRGGC